MLIHFIEPGTEGKNTQSNDCDFESQNYTGLHYVQTKPKRIMLLSTNKIKKKKTFGEIHRQFLLL